VIARAISLPSKRLQHGTVLFVSTIVLLVLSLFAVVMAKTAILENRMAGAVRGAQLAQLAADSAMSDAQATIARIASRDGAKAVCMSLRCAIRDGGAPVDPAMYMKTSAAQAAATAFRIDLTKLEKPDATAQLASSPIYVVEDLGTAPSLHDSTSPARHLFRITAKGVGNSEDFTRVVESVYAVAEEATPAG
jgi:type IV pilus assembly protein PilX